MSAKNKPNELYITRLYDAPVKIVWDAWTDPKKAAKWWGPRGFTITTHSKDLRVGGNWTYTMHGPDGTDYENETKYLEVETYSRLVYDHGGYKDRPPMFRVTVQFTEVKGKTKMEMTMAFPSEEIARESVKFIKKAGGNATWDRLAEYLEKESSGKEKFVINRSFDTNVETMFEMWTNPKHFAQWLGPKGMNMEFIRAEIKPGGTSFYCMTSEDGSMKMYGKVKYIEITKPNFLKYTQEFSDENGNMARHPMAPTWPESMLTLVTFTEEENNKTRVTIEWQPDGKVTAEELAAFVKERAGMTQGWTGSFDKLEEYIISKK